MATTLNDVRLYEENGKYYMSVTYMYEDDSVVKEYIIPKIRIPLHKDSKFEIKQDFRYLPFGNLREKYYIKNEFGQQFEVEEGDIPGYPTKHFYIERIIKEKTHDLTIEEIEKKLGYKIRVVGKEND